MQFKSFMEALKGKQHKIDKNKNGQIDAHDFKLLRKEDNELDEKLTVGGGAPVKGAHGVVSNTPPKKKPDGVERAKPVIGSHEPRKSNQVSAAMGRLRSSMKPVSEETAGESYEAAQKHKETAEEHDKDSEKYHHNMSMHHEAMGRWHESRGRTSLADKEFNKADSHHEQGVDAATQRNESISEGRSDSLLQTTAANADENAKHIFKLRDEHGIYAQQGAGASHHILVPREHEEKARKILAAHLKESEDRMARADFKVGDSGRKSHKEIVFNNAKPKEDEGKEEMKEANGFIKGVKRLMAGKKNASDVRDAHLAKSTFSADPKVKEKEDRRYDKVQSVLSKEETEMSKADMAERERIVKGMKKNLAGFKARYGERAKEVMYATATKQAMKEEAEELDEKSDQAKRNKTMKNMMDASRGARFKLNNPQSMTPKPDTGHKTPRDHNVAIGRALRTEEEVESVDEKVMAFHSTGPGAKMQRFHKDSPAPGAQAHRDATAAAVRGLRAAGKIKSKELSQGGTDDIKTAKGGTVWAKNVKEDTDYIEEANKENPPFDGPYTKTPGTAKDKSGAVHTPMSRAKHLAKMAMKKQMKEDIDRLFEAKETSEYDYEGDMARGQLQSITNNAQRVHDMLKDTDNLPEWVQSKITLAEDYISTVANYMMSEIDEQAPVAPVPGQKFKDHAVMVNKQGKQRVVIHRKNVKNYPEHEGWKEVAPGTKMKESFDSEGNLLENQISYTEFAMMLEYETQGGVYKHKGTYGGNYVDPEGADDADDKKAKQQPADKRGRGRPAGAKSGARKITGTSKLFK